MKAKLKKQIPINQLIIPIYYRYADEEDVEDGIADEVNKIIYDIEEIKRVFDEEIEKVIFQQKFQ